MDTDQVTESPRWAVLFETKNGMFHPARYGKLGGPPISRARIIAAAKEYLAENDWLKRIDDVSPCDY